MCWIFWVQYESSARNISQEFGGKMKRPVGFTVLSLVTGVSTINGIAGSWGMLSGAFGDFPLILGVILLCYGLAAGATTIALWRCQLWALPAMRAWMALFFIFILTFVYQFNSMFLDSFVGLAGFLLFIAALFFLLDRYVRRKYTLAAVTGVSEP
jgi:hypothetical protein